MLIAQITDTHISHDPDFLSGRIDTTACLECAVSALLALRPLPDVVLLTGDLVEHGDAREYAVVERVLKRLPMPVYAVPGNHDSAQVMRRSLAAWMPAEEVGHASFVVELPELRLVGLDTSLPGRTAGALDAERLAWLQRVLSERSDVPVLVFMHHPPIATGIESMDLCGLLEGGAELGVLVARHGKVLGIVCGHVHRNIQGLLGGVPVRVANATAHQISLELEPGAELGYVMEPPCISLHRVTADGLVSHVSYIDRYPGPWPF